MSTLEISIARDQSGADVVIIKDREMREVARVEALSATHARNMAKDCAHDDRPHIRDGGRAALARVGRLAPASRAAAPLRPIGEPLGSPAIFLGLYHLEVRLVGRILVGFVEQQDVVGVLGSFSLF